MPDLSLNSVPLLHQLVPSHVGSHGPAQGTPEQHFASHLQEHYGMQVQNYNQHELSHHANHFAAQHGCGDHGSIAELANLVKSLMAEIAFLKHGGPPPAGPNEETLEQASDRLTKKQEQTEAHIRKNEERLAISQLESKMAKKMREQILQSI